MQCHKCPFYGKGDMRCIDCKAAEYLDNGFRSFVHAENLDEIVAKYSTSIPPDDEDFSDSDRECLKADAQEVLAVLEKCNRKAFPFILRLFLLFASLSGKELPMFLHILHGGTLTSYAKGEGQSKQSAHQKWERMVRAHDELSGLARKNRKRGKK